MSNKLVNLDFLDREAQLYKTAKNEIEQCSLNIETTIKNNTKEESEAVKRAIEALNKKIDSILKDEAVVAEQNKLNKASRQMQVSMELATKTYFKVVNVIRQKGFSKEECKKMEKKVYDKIITKFLTKEEIEMFERMISMGPITIVPGGTIGRNNMLLN